MEHVTEVVRELSLLMNLVSNDEPAAVHWSTTNSIIKYGLSIIRRADMSTALE